MAVQPSADRRGGRSVAALRQSRQDLHVPSFDLATAVAALRRDGSSSVIDPEPGRPVRIDGFTVGAPLLTSNPPHRGEMHPDGDELLYLVSGCIDVIMEDGGDEETVGSERVEALRPGEAILVPKGVWHRVEVREPSRLVHITPGPGDGHRRL
jgi:mannose-6-phosphate isomerase-like protein (cupin superfamily)